MPIEDRLEENKPLAPFTTLGVGGPARWFLEANTEEDIAEAAVWTRQSGVRLLVLGGGSNLVVADAGFHGLAMHVAMRGVSVDAAFGSGERIYRAAAGENWDDLVQRSVEENCAGIECLAGIPGTVGGTPAQNVGAYGQEVSQTIDSVEVFDRKDCQVRELCREACGFTYRSSIFNTTERGRFIILRVTYALVPGGDSCLEYADLKRQFEGRETRPNLAETREAVRHIRARKGMLIVPGDPDCQSAGSFFKNPVLSEEQHKDLEKRAAAKKLTLPSYPALEKSRKVSAAWLVEKSGFARGYGFGHVGISSKHALAIVNRGGATAAEVLALRDQIQHRVEEIWGVHLEPEPVMVGF